MHHQALSSFGTGLHAVVIGASGGIGAALATALEDDPSVSRLVRLSRTAPEVQEANSPWVPIDIESEDSIAKAAAAVKEALAEVHIVLVATGVLHDGSTLVPEKTWRALSADALERAFRVNTIGPALAAKHFLPLLAKDRKSVLAVLSARVGSITDNQLGGWHAYRASKAALNMIVKNLSIELTVRNRNALCVGLHPGTVDTNLSKPFQRSVKPGGLFSSERSAGHLISVLDGLQPADSGGLFAWDGARIPY